MSQNLKEQLSEDLGGFNRTFISVQNRALLDYPIEYHKNRRMAIEQIKKVIINNAYSSIYEFLDSGKLPNCPSTANYEQPLMYPKYSKRTIMKVMEYILKPTEEIVDLIFPLEFETNVNPTIPENLRR